MSSEITEALFKQITPLQTEVFLDPLGTVLPIANSINDICTGKSSVSQDAFMCACRQERVVLVWGDSAQGLVPHGSDVETKILGLVRTPVSLGLGETLLTANPGLGRSNGTRRRPKFWEVGYTNSAVNASPQFNTKHEQIDVHPHGYFI
jgi:hypothetical protein